MPPIITTPPILADPADFSRQAGSEINPFIFIKGSLVYQVLVSASGVLGVFKATFAGVNSAVLDAANAPALRSNALICYSDPSSSIISIGYRDTGGFNFAIVNFDTSTDTYGTPIISTINSGTVFAAGIGLFHDTGTGLYFVVYPAAGNTLSYVTIDSGGTTSAPVPMTTAVSAGQGQFYLAFDQASGTAFCFHLVSIAGQNFDCITLTTAGAIGTPVNLGTDGVEWAEAVISAGTIYVAWVNGDGSKVKTSSAAVATAPSFAAATTLDSVSAPTTLTYISITFIGTTLTVLWCVTDFSTDPGVDEIDYSQFVTGSWTAPAQFYDEITNPPAGALPYPSQFVHTLQVLGTANGGWFGFTAMETADACTGFILALPGEAPPVPTLLCPVASTAQIGVPFSTMLLASGGTPPYTFAILS